MRRGICICLCTLFGCATADVDLDWVAPMEEGPAPIGDPIELAVATDEPDAQAVAFSVDGTEIAVCDPAQPDEDCKRDDVWRWTTVFATTGDHTIDAVVRDADGVPLANLSRVIHVVRELPPEADLAEIDDELTIGEL